MNYFLQRIIALVFFVFSLPIFAMIWIVIKLDDGGDVLFRQKRCGKDKKTFLMYKLRTMIKGAEKLQRKYNYLNEANGPVFKIRDDPRYTRVGKFLAHTGLDELPQLINIIKGEMVFVGPRPLPVNEAREVPEKYIRRFSVLPGATSLWVVKGSHRLTFDEWMRLDMEYVKKKSLILDIRVLVLTGLIILKGFILQLFPKK